MGDASGVAPRADSLGDVLHALDALVHDALPQTRLAAKRMFASVCVAGSATVLTLQSPVA